ncbi:MAG: hypothetical protein IJ484_02145, partial [Oscillospiraceae bacterium]|nr:hypothetical protein [Oscillospiraceae bacterium]
VAMLLPLQTSGGGWDGPSRMDGALSSSFAISIYTEEGLSTEVLDPEFRIYKNGELVQTLGGVVSIHTSGGFNEISYSVDTDGQRWRLECEPEDVIVIRFVCSDRYGLEYDFLFQIWDGSGEVPADPSAGGEIAAESLILRWPD